MSPAPVKGTDVQKLPTPVKMSAQQLKELHAAKAAADPSTDPNGTPAEAQVDLATLLSTTERLVRDEKAKELANLAKFEGPNAFVRLGLAEAIVQNLSDKKNAGAREAACLLLSSLCQAGVGNAVEPLVFEKV